MAGNEAASLDVEVESQPRRAAATRGQVRNEGETGGPTFCSTIASPHVVFLTFEPASLDAFDAALAADAIAGAEVHRASVIAEPSTRKQ